MAIPLLFGTWVVAPNLREYALVDPLAWAFVAGVWLCTVKRQWLLAGGLARRRRGRQRSCRARRRCRRRGGLVASSTLVGACGRRAGRGRRGAADDPLSRLGIRCRRIHLEVGPGWSRLARSAARPVPGVRQLRRAVAAGARWLVGAARAPAARGRRLPVGRAGAARSSARPSACWKRSFRSSSLHPSLATSTWPLGLAWLVALGNALFIARVGGDARLPTVVAWAGLLVACGVIVASWLRPATSNASRAARWLAKRPSFQIPRLGSRNLHVDHFASQDAVTGEVHQFVRARSAIPATLGGAFDEHVDRASEIARVDLRGDALSAALRPRAVGAAFPRAEYRLASRAPPPCLVAASTSPRARRRSETRPASPACFRTGPPSRRESRR